MPTPNIPYHDENRAKSSIKSLNFELSNLSTSHLVTLFEIDLNNLIKDKGINLQAQAGNIGIGTAGASNINVNDGILRFHNDTKILNSFIVWRGKTYYPAPIKAEGFESTTKGVLPQPTLTIASQSESGTDQLALLKNQIREFGDIIGSKVTRIRTFAKYLDRINFSGSRQYSKRVLEIPQGYEPDPYAQLPKDVYFIERKQTETKNVLTYQLSSILDTEGTKLPKRVIVSDKCVWQYRGIGCWYQHAEEDEKNKDYTDDKFPPILKKAEISKLGNPSPAQAQGYGLPKKALPTATQRDERMSILLPIGTTIQDLGLWINNTEYKIGNAVYILKDDIKYYFVCKKEALGSEVMPPNTEYWIADECSKSLNGCRLRWGSSKGAVDDDGCSIAKGQLPFGGFPAARKVSQLK
jgi:lambda family phage minor tail protein L